MLRAKKHAPTPSPSIVFTFGLLVESIKELGGALSNVSCMEANQNYSHTNCFLAPIIPHENKKRRPQRFVCGEPISSWCQIFIYTYIQIPNILQLFLIQQLPIKAKVFKLKMPSLRLMNLEQQ
jgi:hypothetical protein